MRAPANVRRAFAVVACHVTAAVALTMATGPCAGVAGQSSVASRSPVRAVQLTAPGAGSSMSVLARVDSPGAVRHFVLDNPWRIVVDIDGASHDLDRADHPSPASGPLRRIRTSQFGPNTVRIVLDLERETRYTVARDREGVRVVLNDVDAEDVRDEGAPAQAQPPTQSQTQVQTLRRPSDATNPSLPEERTRPVSPLPLPQEGPVAAIVTEIAGSTLYVDAGTRQGLFDGDTLRAVDGEEGTRRGVLTVLSSATSQSLLGFASRPFPITVGDTLHLDLPGVRGGTSSVADATHRDAPANPVQGNASVGVTTTPDAIGSGDDAQLAPPILPTVRGRLQMSMSAQTSSTSWGPSVQPRSRSFLTPTTRLRVEVSDLPGNVTLTANVRGSYRHDASNQIDPTGSFRVYELSIEKQLDRAPIRFQAGRFYSPYEAFSGYHDGALLRLGSDGFGVGVTLGLEPDHWNEGFTTTRPKRSAFMDFAAIGSGRGITGEVAAVQIRPTDGPEHLYFGWAGQSWVGGLNVAHTVQVDRNPADGEWVISDLLVQGGLPLGGPLRVRGTWSRRSPYYFWETTAPVSYQRDDVGGGLRLSLPGGSVDGDLLLHRADGDSTWTRSYAGSFRLHSLAGSRIGAHGSVSFWDDHLLRMLTLSTGVDRTWGRAFGRLGYRMIDSRNAWFELLSHQAEALIDVPVQPGVRATVTGLGRWGRGLRSYRLQLGFWRSF